MSKRARVRTVAYLCAAFAVLLGVILRTELRARSLERQLRQDQDHAFTELTTAVRELDTLLRKSEYASSGGLRVSLCAQGYERACAAQAALGGIPYANVELAETASFLAKTGDYLYTLAGSAAEGRAWGETERETLAGLSAAAQGLHSALEQLQADRNAGALTAEDLEQAAERLAEWDGGGGSPGAVLEEQVTELPALVYDGPFSDHLTGRAPVMLEDARAVSAGEARRAAAAALSVEESALTATGEGGGVLPAYAFTCGDGTYLEVTRQGGHVSVFFAPQTGGTALLTAEQGVARALEYLERRGFGDMAESDWNTYGSVVTVSCAAVQGNVLLYPDLVKVEVSLTDGRVVGLECSGYLSSHRERTLPPVEVTRQQAQAALSPGLRVENARMALIPTRGRDEVLCHQFTCRTEEGDRCLVYVNVQTGEEEDLLLLSEDESGTLAQ